MISIAMATYNGGRFLREQLDSILQQTIQNFELIVCDDCSNDDTWAILREYASKDQRIRLVRNNKNIGFLANFQKAMSLCKGEYIALCDQDDVWFLNHLELLLNNIGNNMLIAGDSELINFEGQSMNMLLSYQIGIDHVYKNSQEMAVTILFFRNWMQGASMMAKREFIDIALPFPEGVKYHDSWFALLACMKNSIVYISSPITKYRQHGNNVSDKHLVRRKKVLIWLKHLLCSQAFPDRLAMCIAIKKKITNMPSHDRHFIQKAYTYHKRQKTIIGRFLNMFFEIRNRKIIYSLK